MPTPLPGAIRLRAACRWASEQPYPPLRPDTVAALTPIMSPCGQRVDALEGIAGGVTLRATIIGNDLHITWASPDHHGTWTRPLPIGLHRKETA